MQDLVPKRRQKRATWILAAPLPLLLQYRGELLSSFLASVPTGLGPAGVSLELKAQLLVARWKLPHPKSLKT